MTASKTPALALAAMALWAFSTPALAAPKNGSFEKPTAPDGSYLNFNTGDHFQGWTVVGDTGNIAIIGADFSYCGKALQAAKGIQFVDLTGSSDSATGVEATVKTQPGATYLLTFSVGNIVGDGNCGTSSTVNLVIDGAPVASFTNKGGKHSSKIDWKRFSTEFTAEGSATNIAFINGDPPGDTANGLDDISVQLQKAP